MDSASPRNDDSGSDDEDEKEKHKQEVRREKNRVKQRNLRSEWTQAQDSLSLPSRCPLRR
jgi:hypothetical protein